MIHAWTKEKPIHLQQIFLAAQLLRWCTFPPNTVHTFELPTRQFSILINRNPVSVVGYSQSTRDCSRSVCTGRVGLTMVYYSVYWRYCGDVNSLLPQLQQPWFISQWGYIYMDQRWVNARATGIHVCTVVPSSCNNNKQPYGTPQGFFQRIQFDCHGTSYSIGSKFY